MLYGGGMTGSREGMLDVPGARLHYRLLGRGPLVLIMQGGDGDADAMDAVAGELAEEFTVLTYDRRGLSRSTLEDPGEVPGIDGHADDAARLLQALSDGPALVVGSSFGAFTALNLLARHPHLVARLIAHEPPAAQLLPASERPTGPLTPHEMGLSFTAGEPGIELPPPSRYREANLEFFSTRDAPTLHRFHLDLEAAKASPAEIVPAAGVLFPESFPRRCAVALAEFLGTGLAELPGGHNGFVTHPHGFAARLQELLPVSGNPASAGERPR